MHATQGKWAGQRHQDDRLTLTVTLDAAERGTADVFRGSPVSALEREILKLRDRLAQQRKAGQRQLARHTEKQLTSALRLQALTMDLATVEG